MVHAARQTALLEHVEHLLELHDAHDLEIAVRAQQRRQELVDELPLPRGHELDGHADALRRPVCPVLAGLVIERQ